MVPSGTIPSIRARSPAIAEAIEVIGETVVATRRRWSSLAESGPDEHAARERVKTTAKAVKPVLLMLKL